MPDNNRIFGFTLLEMIIVLVIMGILAAASIAQYVSVRESASDREAQANLRLILAAERTYRMEDNANQYIQLNDTTVTAQFLKLLLPQAADRAWDYFVHTQGGNTDFCAQATRRNAGARRWSINAPTLLTPDPHPQRDVACAY